MIGLPVRAINYVILLLALTLLGGVTHAQERQARRVVLLDRIVAIINDQVITRRDLDERLKTVSLQMQRQGTPLPPQEALEKQVLERMIQTRVQLQFARDTGLRIDDAALDSAIARIAANNKVSTQELRTLVEKDGISFSKYREDIREEIVLVRLREREVENKIQIADSEIDNFLKTVQQQDSRSEEFNLSHILVRVPDQASPEQLQDRRARAERALEQIKNGTDFRQIAATVSDAADAVQGGLMGWREFIQLPTLFADAVRSMKPGEVSSVLRSAAGFHILRVNERRGHVEAAMVTQTRARHILIKTSELVSENDAKERIIKLLERVENKADFAEIARLQSEDTSASRGGDLGWLSPGDTVPEFEKAMDALKPGEISGAIRSPFGWHIIQVTERRSQDMSQQQQRMRARQALREQKAEEAYLEWTRQLRDSAFVELRLEEK
ncbi:MAG: peptidylprolyl isomerase [Betaproteobacteria bacterium]